MYATLTAAGDFQGTFVGDLKRYLHMQGDLSSACLYHDPELDAKLVFHGGDVGIECGEKELDLVTEGLGKHYEVVAKATLGPGEKDDKVGFLLDRPITWVKDKLLWECGPRQIELVTAELGPVGAKPQMTPGIQGKQARKRCFKAPATGSYESLSGCSSEDWLNFARSL